MIINTRNQAIEHVFYSSDFGWSYKCVMRLVILR
jgi:hypothetical protein